MRVVICGGGVIGASIAYFLSLRQVEAVVVERAGLASAASGKAGGFLALDWCDGSPLAPLARRSFALHGELARGLGRDWGYRRLDTLAVVASARRTVESVRDLRSPAWLSPESAVQARLGTTETTAQVTPAAFTKAMMAAACDRGARVHEGCVTGLGFAAEETAVNGVVVDPQENPIPNARLQYNFSEKVGSSSRETIWAGADGSFQVFLMKDLEWWLRAYGNRV